MKGFISAVWVLFVLSGTHFVSGHSPVRIEEDSRFYNPAFSSSYLIDERSKLEINDIIRSEYQNKFIPNSNEIPEFGLISASIWFSFPIQNLLKTSPYLEIGNPALDTIEYFLFNKEGALVHHHLTGNFKKVEDRTIGSRQVMIDMNLDGNALYTCYLRINSKTSSTIVPMRIASIKKYYESRHSDSIWQGIYFGLILFLVIYNFFLFFSLKELSYLYFALFICCIGLMFALFKGFGILYIWSSFPYFNQLTPLIGALAGIFIILFTSSFLNSSVKTPKLQPWLLAVTSFYFMVIGLNLAGFQLIATKLLEYNSVVVLFFLVFVAIKAWKDGYEPSKYYLLAWSFFVAGFILFICRENGLMEANFILGNILQISSTITILFMSFALSRKINIYIDKRNEAQTLALKVAIENEKLISNQNQLLEAKVNQRTFDLEQTISKLSRQRKDLHEANSFKDKIFSIISHDMKDPIATLAGLLNLMKMKALDENERTSVVNSLELTLKSTKVLLDNILAWANKNDQKEIDEIEVYELVKEVFNLFSFQAKTKNIQLINKAEEGFFISANKSMLQLVLRNLVSNALKFTERNGTIEISIKQNFLNLFLYVEDSGVGMNNEVISRLFETNNHLSTRGTENEKGTGLGLKLCKEFLDKCNGSLAVKSKVGEGSTFTVKLKNCIPILEATLN